MSRLYSCHFLLCLCNNLMLWNMNLMLVGSEKESTEVNAIRVFITDTRTQLIVQLLVLKTLHSLLNVVQLLDLVTKKICQIHGSQVSVWVNCIHRWPRWGSIKKRPLHCEAWLGPSVNKKCCATFTIVALSMKLHLSDIWHEHWPSDQFMLMRPWKIMCHKKLHCKSTVHFICLVNCDVACHLFLWTPKFIKVSKLMLLLHTSETSYPVDTTHMSTDLIWIDRNVVHNRGNYFNIPLFAESQGACGECKLSRAKRKGKIFKES